MSIAIALPMGNNLAVENLLASLYNPNDPNYEHWLTPAEFTSLYCPTRAAYLALSDYCKMHGLTVTGTSPNRLVLDVAGSAGAVESAFNVSLGSYRSADGRSFYAPDGEPSVPASIAGDVSAIVGLDSAVSLQSFSEFRPVGSEKAHAESPNNTGVGGALGPADIRSAYSMTDVPEKGAGQTLGLFELDGYAPSDLATYESAYGLPNVPITKISIDGFSGTPSGTNGQFEVTMDIELDMALAPNISKILVYEAPNNGSGILDAYNRMATDDAAKTVSTSWGAAEYLGAAAYYSAENSAFEEMAAQGQSIFAAAGDCGAYDNHTSLSVDDPASQPYVTGCGGTTLTTQASNAAWESETTWCDPTDHSQSQMGSGGGGGISQIWSQPTWQSGVGSSSTMRNVPDVSLDADPNTGYSCMIMGNWFYGGGTSAAAPLWAALMALVNERRIAGSLTTLGLASPSLYGIGKSALYSATFHDIDDDSTNLYYHATPGYDDATGWGTPIGDALIAALATPGVGAVAPPALPTGLTATAGDKQVTLNWTAPSGATSYTVRRANTAYTSYTIVANGVSSPAYVDSGLTDGHVYYYEVQAADSAGTSAYTKAVTAKPMPPLPGAPENVQATAGNARITISWSAVPNATLYVIRRSTKPAGPFANLVSTSSTSYTNVGLANYTTYYYEVLADNMSGLGPSSASVSATPELPVPSAPAKLTATLSGSKVDLRWSAAAYATSYVIERSTVTGGPYDILKSGAITQPYVDSTGVAGTTYYYVIEATNPTGTSGTSPEASATIPVSTGGASGGASGGTGGRIGGPGRW